MTAATIRASATYRARRKAELARYREALESICVMPQNHPQICIAVGIARAALQGDKP